MQQCLQVLELEGVSRHVMILDREQKSVDVTRTKVTLEAHNDSWRQLAASSPNNPSWAAGECSGRTSRHRVDVGS